MHKIIIQTEPQKKFIPETSIKMPKHCSESEINDFFGRRPNRGKRKCYINRGKTDGRYGEKKTRFLVQKEVSKKRFTLTLPNEEIAEKFLQIINHYNRDRTIKDTVLFSLMNKHRDLKKKGDKERFKDKMIVSYLIMMLPLQDEESVERWFKKKTIREKWKNMMNNNDETLMDMMQKIKEQHKRGKKIVRKTVKNIFTYVKHA